MAFIRKGKPTVLIIVIAALMIVGSLVCIVQDKTSDKVFKEVPATIVEINEIQHLDDKEFEVFVDYSLNHKDYKHIQYGAYNSSMKVGDKVTVRYNVDDPSEIRAPGAEKVAYYIGIMGVVLLLYGLYGLLGKH